MMMCDMAGEPLCFISDFFPPPTLYAFSHNVVWQIVDKSLGRKTASFPNALDKA